MFIEIHAIQNFAPSNLNRDDTGSPKDCEFGGFRRARVSSQCWKRSVREYFESAQLFTRDELAVRTKRLAEELSKSLRIAKPEATDKEVAIAAAAAIKVLGVGLDEKTAKTKDETASSESGEKAPKTSVLLFLGNDQVQKIAAASADLWDELQKKKPNEKLFKPIKDALNGSKAVDLALFGRMIAEAPNSNVDAACQVAHALSTHGVAPEFDYYTAVDDLNPKEDTGAGMIGALEFNSACFYRYANINLKELKHNLSDDGDLAQKAVLAFIQSFVRAIPKAKQNSSAAQSPPSFVMVVVRDKGLFSLANAFAKPVNGKGDGLIVNSIASLGAYWSKIAAAYGTEGIAFAGYFTTEEAKLTGPTLTVQTSLKDLVNAASVHLKSA